MQFNNFDRTGAFKKLTGHAKTKTFDFRKQLDAKRVGECIVPMASGLNYSWAAKAVDEEAVKLLQELANEQELITKYKALLNGEVINTGEKRKVLHHLLRGELGQPVIEGGKNIGDFYRKELTRLCDFAGAVHEGKYKGSTGKPFVSVIQIGIGGSDLGPRALYLALENWAETEGKKKLNAGFISNVDPDDASRIIASCPLDQSLFVLVSKSGTTQETLANELFVKDKLIKAGLDPSKHMIAVTSEASPLAHNSAYLDSFYIDDYIDGRNSLSSAVGGCILSFAFVPEVFKEFLSGAAEADRLTLNENILKNAALLSALIGVWERNFLNLSYTAILPTARRLTPAVLGSLLAHFEDKVMFKGFVWNVNSFDQEGVQIGKILTKKVLSGSFGDDAHEIYSRMLRV